MDVWFEEPHLLKNSGKSWLKNWLWRKCLRAINQRKQVNMNVIKMSKWVAGKLVFCALVLMSPALSYGQTGACRMQWGALNGQRMVQGTVHEECSLNGPWGNWGVTSNVGW